MENISYESFIEIASYAYNLDNPLSFVTIIRQFALASRSMNALTVKNRTFLEDFYYSLFPSVVIPTNATHTTEDFSTCRVVCGRSRIPYRRFDKGTRFIDINGYYNCKKTDYTLGGWPYPQVMKKTNYRCRNPDHYSDLVKRYKLSRYKDLYTRCRDKYINYYCKKSEKSQRFVIQKRWQYENAQILIKEYELNVKLNKNRKRLLKLKDDYEKDKRNKRKRKAGQ